MNRSKSNRDQSLRFDRRRNSANRLLSWCTPATVSAAFQPHHTAVLILIQRDKNAAFSFGDIQYFLVAGILRPFSGPHNVVPCLL